MRYGPGMGQALISTICANTRPNQHSSCWTSMAFGLQWRSIPVQQGRLNYSFKDPCPAQVVFQEMITSRLKDELLRQ